MSIYEYPPMLVFCVVGAYSCSNNLTDILVAIVFGVIGYVAPKFHFPTTPMLIGIVLGSLAEQKLGQTMTVYGSASVFLQRPVSIIFLVLSVVSVAVSLLSKFRAKRKEVKSL